MATLTEITATYLAERVRRDDWCIVTAWCNGEISDEISISVTCEPDELRKDQEYRWMGTWSNHPKYGRQFKASSFVLKLPHGRAGVISYLRDAGEGLGFGAARAARLWDHYGSDAVQSVRTNPQEAAEVLARVKLPIALERMQQIAVKLEEDAALEACTLDLLDVLTGRGFPKAVVRECVREWGNRASQVIRRDPYKLMRFRGCGFKRCDATWLELGLPASRLKRQALAAWYAIARDTEGHTWFGEQMAVKGAEQNIAGAEVRAQKALTLAVRGKALAAVQTDGVRGPVSATGTTRWVAEWKKARNEGELAELIAEARGEANGWPTGVSCVPSISDHQAQKLFDALRATVGILGGGPGTGKTFTVAAMCQWLSGSIGLDQIAIGAPTGKAAVRVTETLSGHGIPLRARTWHSLLRGGTDGGFKFDRSNPLPFRVLIGDESSMVDLDLMAAIFRARAAGTLVLLVGDVNQLPPVGHGAPLRDLIAAGLPYGELTEIKRNSGGIVEACHAIRQGKRWNCGDNLRLMDCDSPEGQIKAMLANVHAARVGGADPVWDCQVVCPVNAKSPLARKALNSILQRELNAAGETAGGNPFRRGDKIVNCKNSRFPAVEWDAGSDEVDVSDRGEVYVANGELARVLHVEERLTVAQLDNPRRVVKIPRGKDSGNSASPEEGSQDAGTGGDDDKPDQSTGTGCSWDLGYCLSVHKAQGSEWPTVIVMLDEYPGAQRVASREFLYTAISRAKGQCVLVGKKVTADQWCRRQAIWQRKTLLKERVLLEVARREVAEL